MVFLKIPVQSLFPLPDYRDLRHEIFSLRQIINKKLPAVIGDAVIPDKSFQAFRIITVEGLAVYGAFYQRLPLSVFLFPGGEFRHGRKSPEKEEKDQQKDPQ